MKILDLQDLKNFKDNTCITIGFFDGIHIGHQKILSTLNNYANDNNLKSVVITFDDSVLSLFKMSKNLMDIENKKRILSSLNIDYLLVLKVSDNFMPLSAKDFKELYLDKLNCKAMICGSDFSFAKNKEGNINFIKENTNYEVIEVNDVYLKNNKISSTYIRNLIINGNIKEANELLYEPFKIKAEVVSGLSIGRTIGFKTANLKITNSCYLLKHGVYFGKVNIDNNVYKAMINVGYNPTVNDNEILKIEVHILSFDKTIYNQEIEVIFLLYHREEKRFDSLEMLKNQLESDLNDLKNNLN